MNGQDILTKNDRDLFPGDEAAIKAEFRRLAFQFHPDRNHDPLASDVFAHIELMKKQALNRGARPSEVFVREDGTSFRMEYLRRSIGQGCTVFTGMTRIAYFIPKENDDLGRDAVMHSWKYADKKMETEMSRFIAPMVRQERLKNGRLVIFARNKDQILMRDLMDLEGLPIEPVHVTWMISRMINLCCYLEWSKISHGAISPEFLLVSLDMHSVSLCGPVLYKSEFGKRPTALPNRTMKVANWFTNKNAESDSKVDLALIRQTALELLGETGGARLRSNPKMRKEITNWLLSPSAKTALDDYKNWETARGDRRFAEYGKTAQVIYDRA